MAFVIPFFELRHITLLGQPILTWVIFWWAGMIAFVIFFLIEAKRLKLKLTFYSVAVYLTGLLIFVRFFEGFLFFLSHKLLHNDGDMYSLLQWNHLGRIYFGALLGLFLTVIVGSYILKETKNIPKYLDIFFLAQIPAVFFYRIGNFINHSHIGKPTSVPWAIDYMGQARHEISLYELLSLAMIFIIVWPLRKKFKLPGFLTLVIFLCISLSRFFLDFLRSNDLPNSNFHFENGFTLNQVAYLTLSLASFSAILYLVKKYRKNIFEERKI